MTSLCSRVDIFQRFLVVSLLVMANKIRLVIFFLLIANVFSAEVIMGQATNIVANTWFLAGTGWQSFTATLNGVLTAVAFQFHGYNCNGNKFNVLIRQDEGTNGAVLSTLEVSFFFKITS